tara:strand:- start:6282 stop:10892 length:4611 start_codon:yes stop_codon:yes gene_type:complete
MADNFQLPPPPVPTVVAREENLLVEPDLTPREGSTVEPDLLSEQGPPVSSGQSALSRTLGYDGTGPDTVFGDTTKRGSDWIGPVRQPPADTRVTVDLEALDTAGLGAPSNYAKLWLDDPTNQAIVKKTPGLNMDIQAMRDAGISDEKIFKTVTKSTELSGAELAARGLEEGALVGATTFGGALAGARAAAALPIPLWWKVPAAIVGAIVGGVGGQEALNLIPGPKDYDRFAVDQNARSTLEGARTLGMGLPFLRMPFSLRGGDVDLGAQAILASAAAQRVGAFRFVGGGLKKLENLLTDWGKRATTSPKTLVAGETSSIVGAGVGAFIAEGAAPGEAGARFLSEVTGALLSPGAILVNAGSGAWSGMKHFADNFSVKGRLRHAGSSLQKSMTQAGLDPEEGLKALQDDQSVLIKWAKEAGIDIDNLDLTTLLPAPQAELIAKVRTKLARSLGPEEVAASVNSMKTDLIFMQQVIDKMISTTDPKVLAAAGRLQIAQNEAVLSAELDFLITEARKAGDQLRPEAARLGGAAADPDDATRADIIGAASKKARDAAATASGILKEAVVGSRKRFTGRAEQLYKDVDPKIPVLPTRVLETVDDIDASVWPTLSLNSETRATLNRIRPGLLDTGPDITATETASATLRLEANTNRQVIKEYDNTVRTAERSLDRLKSSGRTLAKDLDSLQNDAADVSVTAGHQINLGLAQRPFRGKNTAVKPPEAGRIDPIKGTKIRQDWRAASSESTGPDATAAANQAGVDLDSVLVRKKDESPLVFQNRLRRTRTALQQISGEAENGTGQFSSQGVWKATSQWSANEKGVRRAVTNLAKGRIKLINNTLDLSAAQKAFDVPAPNKILKAQTKLAEQEKQLAVNDAYLVDLNRPPPGPIEPLTLREMHNLMKAFGAQSRKFANDPSKNGILYQLGQLSRAAYDDLDATVEAGPNDGTTKAAIDALRKANSYWKAGQNVYLRAYGVRDLFEKSRYGGDRYPLEVYETRIMSGKPEETELRLASVKAAALGIAEDINASTSVNALDPNASTLFSLSPDEKTALVGTIDAATATVLRSGVARIIDSDTGLVNPDKLAKFRSDYSSELKQFPELLSDLKDVKTAQTALDSVRDKGGIFQKNLDEAATLSEWVPPGSNPGIYIAKTIGDPDKGRSADAQGNFERLLKAARDTGDPELLNGIKQSVFDAAWTYGQGGDATKVLDFTKMKSWLTSSMGRKTDSPLTVLSEATMPNGSPVLTEVERIRLFQFLNDGIKVQNIVARKASTNPDDLNRAMWGKGKLTDTTDVIDNPGIFTGMTIRVMGSRMGVGVSKAIQKLPFMGSSGAELIAASAGSRALQEAVQGTPMVAYKTLIFRALSDKDLYTAMMKMGESSKEKFRLAWNYKSALSSLGIQVATPETSLIPEEDPSIEERARLRSELYGPGVIRREDVNDPYRSKSGAPISPAGSLPPPPPPVTEEVEPPVEAYNQQPLFQSSLPASSPAPTGGTPTPQRQRLAALYPFDITAGPIRAAATQPQQVAYGGHVKQKRPGILGLV